jgi:gentisate 1,2-dioxygenase
MPKRIQSYREPVAGRADVEDTPELVAYYDELERLEAGALWTIANKIEPWQPKSSSVPALWRYRELREYVLRSVNLVTPEKAGRRVIYLNNPGRREVSAAVGWLYSGLQVMNPGEVASAHAHSASALRFIMEGAKCGGYSIIDGQRFDWQERDIFCVPSWAWHEHVNASGSGDACLFTFNDLPVMHSLGLYREEAYGDNGGEQPLAA